MYKVVSANRQSALHRGRLSDWVGGVEYQTLEQRLRQPKEGARIIEQKPGTPGVKRLGAVLDEADKRSSRDPSEANCHDLYVAKSAYRAVMRRPVLALHRVMVPRDPIRAAALYNNIKVALIESARDADACLGILTEREAIDAAVEREWLSVKLELIAAVLHRRSQQRKAVIRRQADLERGIVHHFGGRHE